MLRAHRIILATLILGLMIPGLAFANGPAVDSEPANPLGINPLGYGPGFNPLGYGPGVNPLGYGPGINPFGYGPAGYGPGINPFG